MGCKVRDCKERHGEHYCKLCKKKDSNHFSSNCPAGKTLYHGSKAQTIASIVTNGLQRSAVGRLGSGVYFVEEYDQAQKIAEHRSHKKDHGVVYKCHVNLGVINNTGRGNPTARFHDSSTSMHPPWCGIRNDFKEYCLKDSSRCIVTSIFVNGVEIMKNEEKTWGEANKYIRQLKMTATNEDVDKALHKISKLKASLFKLSEEIDFLKDRLLSIQMEDLKCPKDLCHWLLVRWYMIIKIVLMISSTGNGIWSLTHLFSQRHQEMENALKSFAAFFTLLLIARIMFVILHCLSGKPGKVCLTHAICKLIMAVCFEMPMLVSQAYAMKKIENIEWNSYTWDVVLQLQYIPNLFIFLVIDFVFYFRKKRKKEHKCLMMAGTFFILPFASIIPFVPVYLTQIGWDMIPHMSDFGGIIEDGDIVTWFLKFTMYMGAVGIWLWCFLFGIIVIFLGFIIRDYLSVFQVLKALLMLFNTGNGIWSLVHLFSQRNEEIDSALKSFAVFFTFSSIARIAYGSVLCVCSDKVKKKGWIVSLCLTFGFEMPMLVSQAYVLTKINNIIWSNYAWDVALQVQFHVSLLISLLIDFVVLNEDEPELLFLTGLVGIPLALLISAVLYVPVHLAQLGWNLIPGVSDFGGSLKHGDIVAGLLKFSMYMGCIGLWAWTLFFGMVGLSILAGLFFSAELACQIHKMVYEIFWPFTNIPNSTRAV